MKKNRVKLLCLALSLSIPMVMSGCGSNKITVTEDELLSIADPEEGLGDIIEESDSLEEEGLGDIIEESDSPEEEDYSEYEEYEYDSEDDGLEAQALAHTGYDTAGSISFSIYNNTPNDLYSALVGPLYETNIEDLDVLPAVLSPDDSYDYHAFIDEDAWEITDWTIYFTDTAGNTSDEYYVMNLWDVAVVNVTWDESTSHYLCDFLYYDEIGDAVDEY